MFAFVFLFFISSFFISDSFAQTPFDSEQLGLTMPTISMDPIYGTPGTDIEISIENMPQIPKDIDPRIEFFVFIPFFSPLDSDNVPQTCGGEKCITLYSFDEIQQGKLDPKKITFKLFSKNNPKSIIDGGFVESVCDLKINDKVVERYGHACYENDQASGEYTIKFGWGIQSSDLYDITESRTFTVLDEIPSEEIIPKSLDDELIQEFQNGLITVAQFHNGLVQLDYDEQNIRKTKALLGLLDHQFDALSAEERQKITQACSDLLQGEILYVVTDKENYQLGDVVIAQGCVDTALPRSNLNVQLSSSGEIVSEKILIPEADGSFYAPFQIDENFENGTYAAEIIYGEHKKSTSFVVPEFGSVAVILLSVLSLFVIVSKFKPSVFARI
jgi:hypothetical protein